jgi:hypothetical protein
MFYIRVKPTFTNEVRRNELKKFGIQEETRESEGP